MIALPNDEVARRLTALGDLLVSGKTGLPRMDIPDDPDIVRRYGEILDDLGDFGKQIEFVPDDTDPTTFAIEYSSCSSADIHLHRLETEDGRHIHLVQCRSGNEKKDPPSLDDVCSAIGIFREGLRLSPHYQHEKTRKSP